MVRYFTSQPILYASLSAMDQTEANKQLKGNKVCIVREISFWRGVSEGVRATLRLVDMGPLARKEVSAGLLF